MVSSPSPELLRVEGLSKTYGERGTPAALREVSFTLEEGDSLAIAGPSGCGKTTLLLAVAGLLPPTAGSVRLAGRPVTGPSRETALVLQEYGLFPWKTVGENILLGALIRGMAVDEVDLAGLTAELGIDGLDRRYPRQLSGGQRQRVALARALLLNPRLLLLDEPFAALDAITRERLQNRLIEVFRRRGFAFVVVTHSIEEAVFLGRRVLVLRGDKDGGAVMVENQGAGDPGYRETEEFFSVERNVRHLLEGAA
jgi:ABC-type nitrate/sulfonate/bicarbonate transport system ATPase subunit